MNCFKPTIACWLAAAILASSQPAPAAESRALDLARQLNEAFVEVAQQVSPSVVVITIREKVKDSDDGGSFWDILPPEYRRRFQHHGDTRQHWMEGEGSGVIISSDGYILTNNHVVENADEIVVRLKDGRTFTGEVKGGDADSDIAVVKIKASGLTPAKLGDSDATRVGEFVLAIGAPFELSDTVTVGHVSAKGRVFEGEADQDFLQTDARILPGNSGGPLVNLYGEVIGINTMIEGLDTGIGFAVPVNIAKRVKEHLINEGKFTRSYLGIHIEDLKDDSDYLRVTGTAAPNAHEGVLVTDIMPGGPASKSELRAGDVITGVDGQTIQTVRQLRDDIFDKPAGHGIVLDVVRGKEHVRVQAIPAAMPALNQEADNPPAHRPSEAMEPAALGLTVQALTKDVAKQFDVEANTGVLVTDVQGDSPADAHGIKAGDIITEINRQHVSTPRQFRDALKAADLKSGIMVNLISDGGSRFVILKEAGGN